MPSRYVFYSSHHCKYGVNVVHVCVSHSSAYLLRLLTSCTWNMDALPVSSFNPFDAYPCFNIIDRSTPSHGWSGLGLGSLRKIIPWTRLTAPKECIWGWTLYRYRITDQQSVCPTFLSAQSEGKRKLLYLTSGHCGLLFCARSLDLCIYG